MSPSATNYRMMLRPDSLIRPNVPLGFPYPSAGFSRIQSVPVRKHSIFARFSGRNGTEIRSLQDHRMPIPAILSPFNGHNWHKRFSAQIVESGARILPRTHIHRKPSPNRVVMNIIELLIVKRLGVNVLSMK
jgi:hypothetical protein